MTIFIEEKITITAVSVKNKQVAYAKGKRVVQAKNK
jgi:sRNA-binding carbon storage regulator CsrA